MNRVYLKQKRHLKCCANELVCDAGRNPVSDLNNVWKVGMFELAFTSHGFIPGGSSVLTPYYHET